MAQLDSNWWAYQTERLVGSQEKYTEEELAVLGEDLPEDIDDPFDEVCTCYPEHCYDETHFNEFGVFCWCSPVIIEYKDGVVIIHQEES